ncbi:hypothetical protein BKI52_04360 [marine bacterium AO1-C]|nr:hypothetical protein BKI52_04360 [marine bacterium AO1-C]
MSETKTIPQWSNEILDYLLQKRAADPSLKFWLRERNTNQRLDNGYWFQGNENYLFVGFADRSGGSNRTRSIGFVVGFHKETVHSWLEIVFKDENDSQVLASYRRMIEELGEFEEVGENKFQKGYPPNNVLGNLDTFLSTHLPKINAIIKDLNLGDDMLIPDNKFEKKLQNILSLRQNNHKSMKNTKIPLNQIFYGPPGTGKTYHTINEAIKIVDPDFYDKHQGDRNELKRRFQELLLNQDSEGEGQIGFTTFHQSFSYEDFIEGIKPVEPEEEDTYLKYEIEDGVFKNICSLAELNFNASNVASDELISLTLEEYNKANFYKMSLGNTKKNQNDIFEYCVANNCITIGYGDSHDFSNKNSAELKKFAEKKGLKTFAITVVKQFVNLLKKGDYVVISNGNLSIRAVGKVVGDYEYLEESPLPNHPSCNHFRKVAWLFTDTQVAASEVNHKNLSQQTIYKLDKAYLKQDFFVKEKKAKVEKPAQKVKNYVLIIDEINRGNVSAIFGELITLIEEDKRAGGDENLSVILPYSKQTFTVPSNVYIIGTMNTADRSIEALDTALRRRFSFQEMPPRPVLISSDMEGIDLSQMLETINARIEKLIDKDHKIGHAYFMNITTVDGLKAVFQDKVIPLLEEYFFGDLGKISLVLGRSFITKEKDDDGKVTFAKGHDYDDSLAADLLSRAVYKITPSHNWDFKTIYK